MIKILIAVFGLGLLIPIQAQAGPLEEWNNSCRNSGYEDGQSGPFSVDTWNHCDEEEGGANSYYHGFIDGCMDSGNSKMTCEMAIEQMVEKQVTPNDIRKMIAEGALRRCKVCNGLVPGDHICCPEDIK